MMVVSALCTCTLTTIFGGCGRAGILRAGLCVDHSSLSPWLGLAQGRLVDGMTSLDPRPLAAWRPGNVELLADPDHVIGDLVRGRRCCHGLGLGPDLCLVSPISPPEAVTAAKKALAGRRRE